jgi:hypothetical protein
MASLRNTYADTGSRMPGSHHLLHDVGEKIEALFRTPFPISCIPTTLGECDVSQTPGYVPNPGSLKAFIYFTTSAKEKRRSSVHHTRFPYSCGTCRLG